jgi:hypothetical protein
VTEFEKMLREELTQADGALQDTEDAIELNKPVPNAMLIRQAEQKKTVASLERVLKAYLKNHSKE